MLKACMIAFTNVDKTSRHIKSREGRMYEDLTRKLSEVERLFPIDPQPKTRDLNITK